MTGIGGGPREVLLHLVDQVRRRLKVLTSQCSSIHTSITAYDYRRRSPPYHSRRSASPPRCRRPSPGRREDGRFSPRRPPPRDDDREGRPTHRRSRSRSRSRSRTRSRTPRLPAPRLDAHPTEPVSEALAPALVQGADVEPPPTSPRRQKLANRSIEHPETHSPKPSIPVEASLGPTVDTDVTMMDIRPPTQPKAFTMTTAPPTQPKSFNRPPPTGPRLVPTATGQLPPPRQPRTPEPPPAPEPTQSDPDPATAGTPTIEEPEITLPRIEPFQLIPEELKRDAIGRLEKTVSSIQPRGILLLILLKDRRTLAKKLPNACRIWRNFESSPESHA